MKEEILLEQYVRKIKPFRNFLEIAAQMNGKIIEYANISQDVGVDDKTVAEYFQILEFRKIANTLNPDIRFTFFRTTDGTQEMDLILERPGKPIALIEIKSAEHVSNKQIEKLLAFEKDFDHPELYVLCREKMARERSGIRVLPWQMGLTEILR